MISVSTLPDGPSGPHAAPTGRARQLRTDDITRRLRAVDVESSTSTQLVRELIEANAGLATRIAGRYKNRGVDSDDLEQVALLGLTKAAQRFDASAGHDFMSFAVPTIRGELRRYFRDFGWTIRPPRRVQELQARISRARGELEQVLHRSPRPSEVAEHLGVEVDAVVEALTVDGYFTPTSLDATVGEGDTPLGDLLPGDDGGMRAAEAKLVLEPLLTRLAVRERRIVRLRFYEERTQQEIAEEIGLTQAQVSRILARIMGKLRSGVTGSTPAA